MHQTQRVKAWALWGHMQLNNTVMKDDMHNEIIKKLFNFCTITKGFSIFWIPVIIT